MLVGTISNARVRIREKSASIAIGRPLREYEADFIFDYRLIVGPTRQVKLAEVVNIAMKTDEIKQLVKKWEPGYLDFREMADNLISKVAKQVVETIIDRLYPIRIASIDENGVVIINQGGRRIAKGQLLEVVVQGKGKDLFSSLNYCLARAARTISRNLERRRDTPIRMNRRRTVVEVEDEPLADEDRYELYDLKC